MKKVRILFKMFEIIRIESCPKPNQTLFEESSIPWTHCFRQENSTTCRKKGPGPKKSEAR